MATVSLCPVCLERIPAAYIARGQDVYMKKTCPSHGSFETVVWRGEPERFFAAYRQHGESETVARLQIRQINIHCITSSNLLSVYWNKFAVMLPQYAAQPGS